MRSLLTILVAFAFGSLSAAQTPDDLLYQRLTSQGDDSVRALNEIIARADSTHPANLYIAAGIALREKRLEDSGFLFYIARFRVRFDTIIFPPIGTGGDSPMVAFGALQQQLGSAINPTLMAEPKTFSKVLAKVRAWKPVITATYDPGWEFSEKHHAAEAEASLQNMKREFLEGMDGLCSLLQDKVYFLAFRTAQDYNLKQDGERPSKEAFEAAIKTMAKIEAEKGIKGLASKLKA